LQRHRMGLGVNIQVKDPQELRKIQQHELDITAAKIQIILKAGAKIVLTTKGIDDICLKYFVEAGVMACRRINKDDLRRLAKATGGQVVTTLADMDGEESFDEAALGTCGGMHQIRLGESELWQFEKCQGSGAGTIMLRGANEYMLDEMDRALHDSLCVVKRMLESNTLVPGGGAVEAELSVHLEEFSLTRPKDQMAIQEFAEAVLVIPKTLAVNAALDATELVAQLRSQHAKGDKNAGLDLQGNCIRDNLKAGVVEPAMSKIKALRFATEAAITILRIDDRINVSKDQ
jgi:T-complex protein 1 subunit alpha